MPLYSLDEEDQYVGGIPEFETDSTNGSIPEFEDNYTELAEVDTVNQALYNVDTFQKQTRKLVWAVFIGQILGSATLLGLTHYEISKALKRHRNSFHLPSPQSTTWPVNEFVQKSQSKLQPKQKPQASPAKVDVGKIPEKSIEELYKATLYLYLKSESKNRFTVGTCSGIILENGVIATAKHCLDDGQFLVSAFKRKSQKDDRLRLIWFKDRHDPVAVVKHPTLDLALIGNPKLMSKIRKYGMKVGSDAELEKVVLTLGHPTGRKAFTPSTGILKKKTKENFKLSINILPGNSGGGLINTKGEVVGIVSQSIGQVYPDEANVARLNPKDLEILNQRLFHKMKKLKPRKKKKKDPWFDMECKQVKTQGDKMRMKCKYPKKKK